MLQAGVELADREGIAAVTMRNLAAEVGVEAMSLYHHVANKGELLAGMVEVVVGEINAAVDQLDPPATASAWRRAVRERILTARQVLLRHRWAPGLLEAQASLSVEVVRYYNGLLGLMRSGGFSYDLAHHALHALGSRAIGFSQELFTPDDAGSSGQEAEEVLAALADELPYLVEMMAEISHDDPDSTLGWCDDHAEFEFGLDLLLDGLERRRRAERRQGGS